MALSDVVHRKRGRPSLSTLSENKPNIDKIKLPQQEIKLDPSLLDSDSSGSEGSSVHTQMVAKKRKHPEVAETSVSPTDSVQEGAPDVKQKKQRKEKQVDTVATQTQEVKTKAKPHLMPKVSPVKQDLKSSEEKGQRPTEDDVAKVKHACIPEKVFSTFHMQPMKLQVLHLCDSCCRESNSRVHILSRSGKQLSGLIMCQNCVEKNNKLFDSMLK